MRRFIFAFLIGTLMFGGVSGAAFAANCTQDTLSDQAGDWFGTFGKTGMEKDQILAQRKTDRVIACAKREAEKAVKKAQKAGNDMKRNLGF